MIGANEGYYTGGARTVRDQADNRLQTAADLMQLVRVIQAGVDVDGDGAPDLDAAHITYWGWSSAGGQHRARRARRPARARPRRERAAPRRGTRDRASSIATTCSTRRRRRRPRA